MELENMMEMYQPMASRERKQTYFVVGDLESLSASALYGNMDRGYDFKNLGFQLHIHEDSKLGITGAKIKTYAGEKHLLDNFEAMRGENSAISLGIPKINIGS